MQARRQILAIAAATLAAPAILHAQSAARPEPHAAIPDAMTADGRFTSFIALLGRSGIIERLRGAGEFTVFAPTDAGIATIPANILAGLVPTPTNSNTSGVGDEVALGALCNLHIVDGIHPLGSFTAPSTLLRSRNGTALRVEHTAERRLHVVLADHEGPRVGGLNFARPATILVPAVMAANGIILPIDVALLN